MSGNPIPLTLDQPYKFEQPLDMDDARQALRTCAANRHQAREWLQRSLQALADREKEYRKGRASVWPTLSEGTAEEKKDKVNDRTADLRHARDVAAGVVKAAQERLEEIDAERASVHRLVDWSMKVTPTGVPGEPADLETYGARRAA